MYLVADFSFLFTTYSSEKPIKQDLDVKIIENVSMSVEDKVREQNRIRQAAYKAREKMPKDYKSFCLVTAHLIRNAHRYYGADEVKNEEMKVTKEENEEETETITVNKILREIRTLKRQNRIREQQQKVILLKDQFGTYRSLSTKAGVPLKTVHEWCSEPKCRENKATSRAKLKKAECINFLMQDTISYSHPGQKYAGKRFLMFTLNEIYEKYLQQPEYHRHGVISKTTMRMYKPKHILLSGATPINQCLCDKCENCELLKRSLQSIGIKGIPSNKYHCLDATYCELREGQFDATYEFALKKCVRRTCDNCGQQALHTIIEDLNAVLLQENKRVTYHKWFKMPGEKTVPQKIEVKGTLRSAVNEFLEMIETLSSHLFRANWHRNIFQYMRKHMMRGYVLQVMDFAMNFNNRYQDEVQSAYWGGSQTTIHATINFFRCLSEGCSELVTLALVHISDDLHHDSFLSRAAMNLTLQYLVDIGVPLDLIIQFCDNCASQYKSRRPFVEIARCAIAIIRIYFGEKHGKSHADALFGRLKAWMAHKIKVCHFVVKNAFDFYKYCREYYQTPVKVGCCQHYRVEFQFIRPSDIRRHQDSDLDQPVPKTQQIYAVRNTTEPLQLKVRSVPCLCQPCIDESGECMNSTQTDDWNLVHLIPTKNSNKRKYQKRKVPTRKLPLEVPVEQNVIEHEEQEDISYINCYSSEDDDDNLPEISFDAELPKRKEKNKNEKGEGKGKKKKTQKATKVSNIVTKTVTDTVTDTVSVTVNRGKTRSQIDCTWVNDIENIQEQVSSETNHSQNSERRDIEIIEVCERASKEFEMAGENTLQTNIKASLSVADIVSGDIPEEVLWPSILSALDGCKDFLSLQKLAQEIKEVLPQLKPRVTTEFSWQVDVIDTVAQKEIPHDGPTHLTAIRTLGDGNCLCRALSRAFYNNDSKHIELRARIVLEGITNMNDYLNDDCLERGASYIHSNAELPTVFATFSEFYTPGQKLTEDTVNSIYCLEIHSCARMGTYMGLWQLAQASSVLGIPLHTIYPVRGDIGQDFHRIFFPVEYPASSDDIPIVIMWTGLRTGSVPVHFVPLINGTQ